VTQTRAALERLAFTVRAVQGKVKLPAIPATAWALQQLSAPEGPPAEPDGDVLLHLHRRFVAHAKAARSFDDVPTRDMRTAVWLLWRPKEPLAALPGLFEAFLERARTKRSLLRTMVEAWLQAFAGGVALIREAGLALRNLLPGHQDPRVAFWRRADVRFNLFDAEAGPATVARRLLEDKEEIAVLLAATGLDHPIRGISGYARAVQMEVLALAPTRLTRPSALRTIERLSAFLAPAGQLRFPEPEPAGAMARALLAPWLAASRPPNEEVRAAVQDFLLKHLRDPRLHPQLWRRAGEEVVGLIRRWLVKVSLETFFELIRKHALDRHWTYREAFWSAYFRADVIQDAWLGLGEQVHREANAIRDLNGAFGRLEGYGVQSGQSILLLRLGDTVFCEWSHNGKLRAWPVSWDIAPKLGKPAYSRRELVKNGLTFPMNARGTGGSVDGSGLRHAGSDSGSWQGSAALLISNRLRIHLTAHDWMPK